MTHRFDEFQNILAAREAALVALAGLSLALLSGWLAARAAFGPRTQDRLIAIGTIGAYIVLFILILGGSS